jgi:hypothetical protein
VSGDGGLDVLLLVNDGPVEPITCGPCELAQATALALDPGLRV